MMNVLVHERLARAIALLLGCRLLSTSLRWLVSAQILSPPLVAIAVGLGAAIGVFAYVSTVSHPLATLQSRAAQLYGGIAVVGLVLGVV